MVKRSTKSKSKRTSIRKKHKIARKVKAHHRKQRRTERLRAKQKRALGLAPSLKDPGVPASWPFREDFIKEMAFEKDRILAEKIRKKSQTKNKTHETQISSMEESEFEKTEGKDQEMAVDGVEALAEAVQQRAADYETVSEIQQEKTVTPDVGGREHYKDFRKVVTLSDVVLQVLDARDPNGCRSSAVESFVHQFTPPKRLVFLLNKIDLVPRDVVESWLKVLRQYAPTIAFKCSTQRQNAHLGQSRNRTMESKSSVCLGADNVIQLLKNYTRNANIRTAITVGLVGVPNVGKSSVINSLKRSKATHVGNRPGVTTAIQEVHLDSQIRLLDSPGVIYEKKQGALQGVVCTEALEDPIGMVEAICNEVELSTLKSVYGIEDFENAPSFLQRISTKTGKLKKGGLPDTEAAARIVVQDWNNGKIPFYKMPPAQQTASDVQIVQNWAEEFSLDGVNDPIMNDLIDEQPQMSASLESSPPPTTVIPGALEAFSQMAEVHKTKEQINETKRAMTDMCLNSPPPKEHSPPASSQQESLEVRVIHAKRQLRSKKTRGPVNEMSVNAVKPKAKGQSKISKRRARKGRKRANRIADSLAENLKL